MTTTALAAAGRDPTALVGGRVARVGRESARGQRPSVRRRSRRIRPLVPRAVADRRRRQQHRGRPPRHLHRSRRHQARVRAVRARRAQRSCCAPTTPARTRCRRRAATEVIRFGIDVAGRARRRDGPRSVGRRDRAFDVVFDDEDLGASSCAIPGRHNVLNALAALVGGLALGADVRRDGDGPRDVRRRRASLSASRRGARRRRSSTTTRTTRAKIAATLADGARRVSRSAHRRRVSAASLSRARATSRRSSARRSPRPTRCFSPRSIRRASSRSRA